MATTTTTPPAIPAKSSFWTGFKSTVKTDAKAVETWVEKEVAYTAEAAFENIKTEATKLDALIAKKVESIIAHNQHILSIQNDIKSLETDVAKATALKNQIATVISTNL